MHFLAHNKNQPIVAGYSIMEWVPQVASLQFACQHRRQRANQTTAVVYRNRAKFTLPLLKYGH